MTRRTRTALTVSAAAVALLLTGCGGSDGSSDEIEGADKGGSGSEDTSQDPNPTPEDDRVDRPKIVFPEQWENVYEDWESGDPKEHAVLRDVREAQNAVDLAILERDPEAGYVSFYHADSALINTKDWIDGFIRNGRTIAGTVRYLNPDVTFTGDGTAVVNYCGDESEASAVDVETGEKLPGDTGQSEVSYANTLREDERGVWVTTVVHTERGKCA